VKSFRESIAAKTIVHVRVNQKTKRQAAKAVAAMGMSVSDADRIMLVRVIAVEKALPFEARIPNAATVQAIALRTEAWENGQLPRRLCSGI
jgi:DNA-damage-inducible protein J